MFSGDNELPEGYTWEKVRAIAREMIQQRTTAQDLIDRSISHNEIAHSEYDAEIAAQLETLSENGGTRNDSVTEYWGILEGDEWRVHLVHAE